MGEGEIGGRDYMMVAAAFAESAGALGNMATLRERVSWVNSGETPVYANGSVNVGHFGLLSEQRAYCNSGGERRRVSLLHTSD